MVSFRRFAVKQKRFNVKQIAAVLKQAEAGVPLATDLLSMEEAVCGTGSGPGSTAEATPGREYWSEAVGRRSDARQSHAARCSIKKILAPSQRGQVVGYLHESYWVSERRACRVARINRARFR
jgi:hypothetical protein